jgi:hypothetical protein
VAWEPSLSRLLNRRSNPIGIQRTKTNDKQQTTNDKRQTTNDKRQTTKLKRGMIIRATIRRYHTTPHRTSATSISHYADPIDSV